jgi:hypothetical protein
LVSVFWLRSDDRVANDAGWLGSSRGCDLRGAETRDQAWEKFLVAG